jgi:hypothetical protein
VQFPRRGISSFLPVVRFSAMPFINARCPIRAVYTHWNYRPKGTLI